MTTEATPAAPMRVEVVYALPEKYWSVRIALPEGATVSQALAAARIEGLDAAIEIDPARLAVFSRPATLATILRDGDRLELLRSLSIDPKQGRRARADSPPKKR